jgi:molybdate transport system ATP-binding protein
MQIHAKIHLSRASGFTLDIELIVKPTGVTALYGPSGSGKSTVLRLLAGLERTKPGDQVLIRSNENIWQSPTHFEPVHLRNLGYVFQQPQLFPHLSVRGNLEYAIHRRRGERRLDLQQVSDWLGIRHLLNASTTSLSGGEAQRVAIARVLLSGAQCLLMDEPLGSIDYAARLQILPYIDQLRRLLDIPIVYVSHALDEITYLADDVYILDKGRVTARGSVFDLASSLEVNSREGDAVAAVVEGLVDAHDPAYGLSRLRLGDQSIHVSLCRQQPGTRIRLRIPARDVSLTLQAPAQTSILNVLNGVVSEIEPITDAPGLLVKVQVGQQFILSRITRKSSEQLALNPGKPVFIQIKTVALLNEPTQQVLPTP